MAGVLALSSLLTPFCLGTVIGSVVTGRAGTHSDPASSRRLSAMVLWSRPPDLV
jgi:cytochrome bd-type quinol oxidase subunit 2